MDSDTLLYIAAGIVAGTAAVGIVITAYISYTIRGLVEAAVGRLESAAAGIARSASTPQPVANIAAPVKSEKQAVAEYAKPVATRRQTIPTVQEVIKKMPSSVAKSLGETRVRNATTPLDLLFPSEIEYLMLFDELGSADAIAEKLNKKTRTIETALYMARVKLGADTCEDAVRTIDRLTSAPA